MEIKKEHIRHYFLYKFNKKSMTVAAYHSICRYAIDAIDESTCSWWCYKFMERDRSAKIRLWVDILGRWGRLYWPGHKKQPKPNCERIIRDLQCTLDNGPKMVGLVGFHITWQLINEVITCYLPCFAFLIQKWSILDINFDRRWKVSFVP